jgi:hypothetical protein
MVRSIFSQTPMPCYSARRRLEREGLYQKHPVESYRQGYRSGFEQGYKDKARSAF